jgi:hypothetical protein
LIASNKFKHKQKAEQLSNKKGKLRFPSESGAGKESRTLDLNLGKVALYQLSYSRIALLNIITAENLEREKSLELSTSTLARLRSTN